MELFAKEISILTVLAHLDGPGRIKSLADMLGRDATTVSRQIVGLGEAGWVQRSTCPEDGRASVVTIPRAGSKLVERTIPWTRALRRRAMCAVSKSDSQALVRALKRMLSNLREDD